MSFPTIRASLRTKLVAAFLVVALIPLGVQAFLNDQTARASLTEAASRSLLAAASQTATSIDSFVQANLNAIGSEAQLPALGSYLSLPAGERAGSPEETEVQTLLHALKTKENRGFTTISSYAFIQAYFLLDSEGRLLLSTAASEESQDHSHRSYFQEGITRSEPYVSPVEFSSRGEASFYFAASVRDSSRRPAGVLVMRYNAIVLQQLVVPSNNVAGEQSYGMLLDENHLRLAHGTTPELLYKLVARPSAGEVTTLQETLRLPERSIEQLATDQSALEVQLAQISAHPSFITEGAGGEAEQVAVARLATQPWMVAFFQPESVFLAPAREQSRSTFFLGLGSAAGVVLLAMFLARRLSWPMIELASGAERVAQGRLNQPVPVRSRDELGILAQSFNAMQQALQDSYEQLRHRVTELTTLQQVSIRLGGRLDQGEVLNAVIEGVQALLGPTEVRLFFYDPARDELSFAAMDSETLEREGTSYPPRRDGLTAQVARTGRVAIINDPASHPLFAEMVKEWPLQALASIPIRRAERTLAVLNVSFIDRPYQFSDDDVRALSVLAEQAALALDNALLHQQTQAALHSTETLYRAAWAISGAKNLQEICQNLASYSNTLVQAHCTRLFLVDHEKRQIVQSAAAGTYQHELQSYGELERGISGRVFKSAQPILSLHADDGIEPEHTRIRRHQNGVGSLIVVPLVLKGQVIGTITTINRIEQRVFTQHDVEMLMALTAHAVTAIENVELVSHTTNWAHTLEQQVAQRMRELERRATQIATVAEVARVVTSLLDPDQLIAQVVELIQERFGFYYVGLFLLDESGEYAVLSQGSGEAGRLMKERTHRLKVGGQSMVGWVCANYRARIALDVGEEPVHFANPLLPDTHSEIALPLHIGGQILGVLDVQSTEVAAFDESDVAVLQNMTDQVSVALENARLYTAIQQELVERRQAEAALRTQKQLFENLVAIARATVERPALEDTLENALIVTTTLTGATQGSIFLVDEEGVVTHSILGRKTEQAQRTSIVGKVMKAGLAGWVIRERQPALIADTFEDERWLLLPDAPFVVRSALAVPIISGGSLVGILTLQHEEPDHFNLEHLSLMQASADQMALALRNAQMYEEQRDLADQLLAAKEAAEAANRAKSDFLATMSHELRTPLNAVLGMTNLLLNTPVTSEQKEYAETILHSGDALLSLINDLLDFSKIEAGKLDTEQQPFDLRECVESSLDQLAARAAEKGLALAYKADSTIPGAIVGDVTRLRQVLVNLLGNAVKFTETGEVLLTVTATPLPASVQRQRSRGEWYELHFAVKDTGIGIPPERRDHLFKAFSQGDASMTRRYGGTGLGLVISRRLTELMGGRMWVESQGIPGLGSTFHFTIKAPAASTPRPPYLSPDQPQLRGKRLLIVGENATSRSILKEQLQAWGMIPQESASSQDALSLLRQGSRFDAAILDAEFQGGESEELRLAAEIRQQREMQALPLVLLTSVARREITSGNPLQFVASLSKPIKPSHLYDTLVSLFAEQAERAPTPTATPSRAMAALPTLDPEMAQRVPLRILMAEDNQVNQKLALRILKHLGYQVDVAENGVQALKAVQEQPYDVILMDVQMPEMDGLEATQRIRELGNSVPQPHIIAMTANAMRGDRERCLDAGMNDYVSKPIQVQELVRALSGAQAQSTTPAPANGQSIEQAAPGAETAEATEVPPVLDISVLDRLRETLGKDAPEFLAELIATFFDDTPTLLAAMRSALEQNNDVELRRAAHTLKSNSASLGAITLAALCKELEVMAQNKTLEGVAERLTEIEALYEKVKDALEASTPQAC